MIPDHGLSVHRSDYTPGVPIGAAEDERPLLSDPCCSFCFCLSFAFCVCTLFSSQNLFNSWPRTDRSRKPLAKNKSLKKAFSTGKPRKTRRKAYIYTFIPIFRVFLAIFRVFGFPLSLIWFSDFRVLGRLSGTYINDHPKNPSKPWG